MFSRPTLTRIATALTCSLALLLAGCDLAELLADPKVAQKEADSKAIGGACRHGLRSIEDCYSLNDKASRAAVFAGWKEMDQYMRDNKIEGVAPQGLKPAAAEPVEDIVVEEPKGKSSAQASAKEATKANGK